MRRSDGPALVHERKTTLLRSAKKISFKLKVAQATYRVDQNVAGTEAELDVMSP
jgi:hypothetical protein